MEFNRPSIPPLGDPRPPPPNPNPSPSTSFLSHFSLQGTRSQAGIPTFFCQRVMAGSSSSPRVEPIVMGNLIDAREMLQKELERERIRELEKERIRDEIIASEIVRRRILEAEVRRELMIEREMALRHADDEFFGEDRFGKRHESSFSYADRVDHHMLYDHGASLGQYVLDAPPHRLSQLHEDVPRTSINRDRLIVLEKPNPNLSGSKRKAEEPLACGAGKPSGVSRQKTPKEDWSCALCHAVMTSERGLQEHIQGKKHKAKEARLRVEKLDKNHCKKIDKPAKPCESSNSKPQKELSLTELEVPSENKLLVEDLKNRSCKAVMREDQQAKKKQLRKSRKTQKSKDGTKFKFWCEICQIGTHSQIVMENHKLGKKHRERLKGVKLYGEAGDATPSAAFAETNAGSVEETVNKVAKDDGVKLLIGGNKNDAADTEGSISSRSM